MSQPTTILVADDHQIVRSAIRSALASAEVQRVLPNTLIAEVEDGRQAIEAVRRLKPDLLILDVAMPQAGGVEVVFEVKRWSPETKTVVFTGVSSPSLLSGLIDAGVNGLFHKSADFDAMLVQIPLVLRGAHYVDAYVQQQLRVDQATESLTQRERQVLNQLIRGQSNREIGGLLGISPKTVDKHRSNMMAKLQVHSFTELMRYALKEGLIDELSDA